jgi:hypothetical protein
VRWTEDWGPIAALTPKYANSPERVGYVMDQAMLTDTMWSSVKNRLQYATLADYVRDDPEAAKRLNAADDNVSTCSRVWLKCTSVGQRLRWQSLDEKRIAAEIGAPFLPCATAAGSRPPVHHWRQPNSRGKAF